MRYVMLTLVLLSLVTLYPQVHVHSALPVQVPRHLHGDPSSSFYLLPGYYQTFSCTIYSGQNMTGQLTSSNPVTLLVLNSTEYQEYSSTGSSASIFSAYGVNISFNVGPLQGGQYYVVVENNNSLIDNIFLTYRGIPLVPFTVHSSPPAPIGIADYGVDNTSTGLRGYVVKFNEAIGKFTIYSISAYNATPPQGISPYSASLQFNLVLQVNTLRGSYQYWLQNVPIFLTNNHTVLLVDNVWNLTSYPSVLSNSTVSGQGHVYSFGRGYYTEYYYAYGTSNFSYTIPFSGELYVKVNPVSQGVLVMFGFYNGTMNWYDNVTIHQSGVRSAYLLVDGFNTTGSGSRYDAELVFGGGGGGEITYFNSMNASLSMSYLVNGSPVTPRELYGYGADTAEAADNLKTSLVNGEPVVTVGQENFFEPLYPVQGLAGHFSFHVVRAEEGSPVLVNVSVQVLNGVGPYIYRFYLDHVLVKEVSGTSSLSIQLDLGVLSAGPYNLSVVVVDGLGQSVTGSTQFSVGSGPVVTINAPTLLDYGQPLTVNLQYSGGTPPYTVTLYVNGTPHQVSGNAVTLTLQPGTYVIFATVTDSLGVSSSSNRVMVKVNPDPSLTLSFPTILDVGQGGNITYSASGGTPPYHVVVYLNGTPVGNHVTFTRPGIYLITVILRDSLNYTVTRYLTVTVNPDPQVNLSSLPVLDAGQVNPVNVTVSGGTPPYRVVYSVMGQTFTSLVNGSLSIPLSPPPGNYTLRVTVVDSLGVSVTRNVTFQVNPDPSLTLVYNSTITDQGVPISLQARYSGGTPPYQLEWSTGSSSPGILFNDPPGNYTVTVNLRDGAGFTLSRSVTLVVHPRPQVNFTLQQTSLFLGGALVASSHVIGGTPPYSYTWLLNGRDAGNGSELNLTLSPGEYNLTLVVRDSLGVPSTYGMSVNVGYGYVVYLFPAAGVLAVVVLVLRRK
ncbi:Thermopsin [Metallosphaera sp. J1]|uniref:thermopsin family protease n=1 Tax=Metallosphaera javensis (ex Hofmann et al. 2022) TaxID=99938 RepID=UPI001EE0360D|nr:thermopsin family protease [Metallosphaera javensis (ex Hofmann et al. 2022)]MCG3109349.1 Thermopsin [Metallosphaera javensis (ex Hofmann et al. 2022)]